MGHRLAPRLWRTGELFRPCKPFRFPRCAAGRLRNFRRDVRLFVQRLQLDLRAPPAPFRAFARPFWRPARRNRQHDYLERGLIRCSHPSGIGALFASRLLLGIGEAPTFPAYAKATGYWFPKDERSLATAMFDSAAKFSSALGVPVLGLMLLHFGWRWNFAATGLISVLFFALFYAYYRNPSEDKLLSGAEREYIARGGAQPEDRERAAKGAPLAYLLQQRRVWGLALGFASYNYSFYLLLAWLPSYLSTTHHIDLLRSALYTSVPWIIATVLDLAVGGWLVDALIQRGRNPVRVRQAVLIGGTALGLGILGAANAHTAATALFWISVSIGGLSAASPVGWSIPSLIAPKESVGTVGGILNFCNQVSGIAAPIVTGYVVQATHSFSWAFAAAGIFLLIGIAGYVFLLGSMEPVPEPA